MLALQMMSPIAAHAEDGTPPPAATDEPAPPEKETGEESEEVLVEEVSETEKASAEEVSADAPETEVPPTEEEVSAEEETPVEESIPEETEAASVEGETITEKENPAEDILSEVADEEVPAEEETPIEEAPPVEETEDLTVAEALEQAPDGTEIAVVNDEGQLEPLATQEAADIVAEADPIWCPDSVTTPMAGTGAGGTCSPSHATMTDMVNWLLVNDANLTVDGTIWIEKTFDSAAESVTGFTLDGTNAAFTNFDQHALTIQGGWDGIGTNTIDSSTPSTFTGDYLHILNWNASVTLNDMIVDGAADDGIHVTIASGSDDIILENVTSSNNTGSSSDGAELENDNGTGNVTLKGTNVFNNNGDDGLEVDSKGDITIKNVTASENGEDGTDLDNCQASKGTCTGSGKITLDGTNIFNENDEYGLSVETNGDIIADSDTNITATFNGEDGAYLDNDWDGSTGVISLLGTNVFNSNDHWGLYALSRNSITLNNITANSNGLGGAVLQTHYGNVNVFTGQFNGNGADAEPDCESGYCEYDIYYSPESIGLAIASWEGVGQILLKNVQASSNYGDGAVLFGDDVLVYNSTFNNNGQYVFEPGIDVLYADGLYIETVSESAASSAYIRCVRANNNAAFGIDIFTGEITLNNAKASGNLWDDFNLGSDTLNILDEPCGKLKTIPNIPWQIIPIIGDESIELNCFAFAGTVLVLPNGDEIRLPCPTIGDATLNSVTDDNLPGSLPKNTNYVSALTAQVINGGIPLEALPAEMIISFLIPADMPDANLAIMYWNGGEWVEIAGGYKTADGRFEVSVNFTGSFMLVSMR